MVFHCCTKFCPFLSILEPMFCGINKILGKEKENPGKCATSGELLGFLYVLWSLCSLLYSMLLYFYFSCLALFAQILIFRAAIQQAAASARGKAPRLKAAVIRQWEGSFFTCLGLIGGLTYRRMAADRPRHPRGEKRPA